MKMRKVLLTVFSALLIVTLSVGATVAYLTSTDEVKNTFTVGKVAITLDEAKVGDNGKALTGDAAERVAENKYHLFPDGEYDKDPTVLVDKDSEDCWVFVKVENGIAALEENGEGANTIASQITANDWTALTGVENVYYRKYDPETKPEKDTDYKVFEKIVLDDALNNKSFIDADNDVDFNNATVKVTAYAIQADGFDTAAAAWNAGNFGN